MRINELFKQQIPTLEQLHSLVRFVDAGSLAAGFGDGKSAQAAATQQLGRIDACFGIKTRKSSGQYKVPSEDAKALAEISREFLQKLTDFKATSERKPGDIVVGAGDSLTFYLLIPALGSIGSWKRTVSLQIQNLRNREIVNGVLDGSLDVGLVRSTAVDAEMIRRKRIRRHNVCDLTYAFYASSSLLAKYPGSRNDEEGLVKWCSKNLPLATFWSETSTFNSALAKSRVSWRADLRCESFPQVKEAILSGGYCGILPNIALERNLPGGVEKFGGAILKRITRQIAMIWSAGLDQRRSGGQIAIRELTAAFRSLCGTPTRS